MYLEFDFKKVKTAARRRDAITFLKEVFIKIFFDKQKKNHSKTFSNFSKLSQLFKFSGRRQQADEEEDPRAHGARPQVQV